MNIAPSSATARPLGLSRSPLATVETVPEASIDGVCSRRLYFSRRQIDSGVAHVDGSIWPGGDVVKERRAGNGDHALGRTRIGIEEPYFGDVAHIEETT